MSGALHILQTAINAVVPIVLLVLLGYLLRKFGVLNKEFVKVGNKFSFNVAIPCMLFLNVYDIESFEVIRWDVVIYSSIMLIVLFGLGYVTAILTTKKAERRGVILQGCFRSNMAILGLSLATSLGGSEAVAIAAVITAFSMPILSLLSVVSLSIFVNRGNNWKSDIKNVLLNVIKNPLIIGIAIGMVFLLIRGGQQAIWGETVFSLKEDLTFVYNFLGHVKAIASPFALIILGAQFDFSSSKGMLKEIVVTTSWRVFIAPLIGIGTAILLSEFTPILNFGVNEYPSLIALFATPVAVTSAIMASQMNNDEQLATQLVVWSSLVSIVTMLLIVCLMMAGGYLIV